MNAHGQGTPLPPDGLRPGQLGVVLLGRVIVGDIAATLVDLAGREIVQVDEDQDEGTWQLGASSAGRHRRQELHGYEEALQRALPTDRMAGITDLAPTYLKAMARARSALIRDAVRRGWLRRFGDGQRTRQGRNWPCGSGLSSASCAAGGRSRVSPRSMDPRCRTRCTSG